MLQRIHFVGSFADYFVKGLLLTLLTIVTLGLASPYLFYWSLRYFFSNLMVDGRPVRYTGSFGEYFLISVGLFLLTVVTFGLAGFYWAYWSFKYFFDRLEIETGYDALPGRGTLQRGYR